MNMLKHYRPITPSLRGTITVKKSHLWKGDPEKSLASGKKSTGGRNNQGRITSRHRGGRRVLYREVDFARSIKDMSAEVVRLEYDPNRTAFIALIKYEDGTLRYIIAPDQLKVGDTVISSDTAPVKLGNCGPIGNFPVGTTVHNIEMKAGKGGQLVRSAGSSAEIVGREGKYVIVQLTSKEIRKIHELCSATVGTVSNPDNMNASKGKAGRTRWMGRRPHVLGNAMNPVDHPHGGRTSGGKHPVSPTGQPTKGYKTRRGKRPSDKFIVTRRVNKRVKRG